MLAVGSSILRANYQRDKGLRVSCCEDHMPQTATGETRVCVIGSGPNTINQNMAVNLRAFMSGHQQLGKEGRSGANY